MSNFSHILDKIAFFPSQKYAFPCGKYFPKNHVKLSFDKLIAYQSA